MAERKNRTIMNMVRSMLSRMNIPKVFWLEAVNWSVHILNRSPTLAVKNMTPQEAWTGYKLSIDYFRILGCITYTHVLDEKRSKLDNKGTKCVFLGISEESKAYRLYNLVTKKIIISRDVIFDEDSNWTWSREGNKPLPIDLEANDESKIEQVVQVESSEHSSSDVSSHEQPAIEPIRSKNQ